MLPRAFRAACAALALAAQLILLLVPAAQVHAQSVTIPLFYANVNGPPSGWSLGITVGINGGTPQPYLFDTGSSVFNAAYNPATWGQPFTSPTVPPSTVPNGSGVHYCYGSPPCYNGNLIQVPNLSFYAGGATTNTAPSVTLSAGQGYQINAVYESTSQDGKTITQRFPEHFEKGRGPILYDAFYGIFGAGNFASYQPTVAAPDSYNILVGGVLGQTIIPGVLHQGYVVSANGQPNPATSDNGPTGNQIVTIGGQSQQVSPCVACVTVGLTPQLMGQFAPVSAAGQTGVVQWGRKGPNFPNPYGSGAGNNGSTEFGSKFTTTLDKNGSTVTNNAYSLLDTGTTNYSLNKGMKDGDASRGSTLSITGADGTIPGLPTTTATLTGGPNSNDIYSTSFSGSDNVIGIPFFMQNSVMFDLTGQTIGYTPFFVTTADLVTTAGGPLIVGSGNVPLGLAGVISGPGGMILTSGGYVQLSATNTYTGETRIDDGAALFMSGPGSIAASSGVKADGLFDISRAWNPVAIQNLTGNGQVNLGGQNLAIINANGMFSGVIADGGAYPGTGGSLSLTGGALVLSGANTYTGGTSVSGGATLGVFADSGLGATSGGLALNGGALAAMASFSTARAVTLGAGGGAFNTNGNNLTLASAVSGPGGLTKTGGGILTLAGANTYGAGTTVAQGTLNLTGTMIGSLSILSGATFTTTGGWELASGASFSNAGTFQSVGGGPLVNQGTLVNNGVLAANLNNPGRLSGTGTVNGTVTNLSGGIVAPGNSIGTLNVVGSLTQAAGSSFEVETNSAGQADRVNVSGAPGTTTIAGGTVTLTGATGVYAPSTTYTILNATGGVTGTFANANSLFPFLQPSLSYDANNVFLTLKPGGFGAGAGTANQAAVGRVLDASVAGSSGDLATVIGTMATYPLAQGQAAMNALSGQNYSGFGTANLGGGLLFMNGLGQQMSLARGGFGGGTRVALAQACETNLAEACDAETPSPWSLWGSALGGTGRVAGTANAGTLTYNAGGFATGLDYRFDPRFLAGIGVGFSSGNQWASGFSGQGTTSSYQASLYASFTQGAFYLDGMAGYGYSDNWMTRQIALPNLAVRTAQGRTGANQFLGQVEAGYRIGLHEPAALSVTPFARFQGMTNSQYGFTESGAGALSLTVAPQTTGSARSVLGAELAGAFGPEGREKLAVQMRLGWAHEYANTARPVTASFAGAPGANFTVFGAAPQRDTAAFSLAANTVVAPGTSLYLRYDGEVGNGISTHALNGGLRMTW